jgi:hypothetical protein
VTGRYLVEALLEQQKQNGQPTDVSLTGLPLVAVLPAVRLPSQSAAAMQPLNSVNASLTAGPSIVDVAPRAIVSGEQLGMIPIVLLCVLVATLIIIGLGCASWTGIKRALALDKEPSSKEPQLPTHLQNRAPPVSSSVGWFELVTFSWVANMLARARDAARAGTQFKFSQLEPLWKTESFELAYEQTVPVWESKMRAWRADPEHEPTPSPVRRYVSKLVLTVLSYGVRFCLGRTLASLMWREIA